MIRTAHTFDTGEISALLQLGRAALSSPDRTPDALTHEGLILLLDLIDEQIRRPSGQRRALDPEEVADTLRRQAAAALQGGK